MNECCEHRRQYQCVGELETQGAMCEVLANVGTYAIPYCSLLLDLQSEIVIAAGLGFSVSLIAIGRSMPSIPCSRGAWL